MTALYQIASDFAKLSESDMDPDLIADTLDGIEWALEGKVEQILAICKNEEAHADALRKESKNLSDRAKSSDARIANMKAYIARSLETAGKKSLQAGLHQVSIRAAAKSVEITNAEMIPAQYVEFETLIKPDKLAIKKQIEAGIEIPGATIKVGKPSLIIK